MAKLKRQNFYRHSLSTVVEEFISQCKANKLASDTIKTYQTHIDLFEIALGEITIEELNETHLQKFNQWLEENRNYNDVSTNTVRRSINVFLKYIHKTYHLKQLHFDFVKVTKTPRQTFTDDELKRLLHKPDLNNCTYAEYRDWVVTQIILSTGARASSIVNLKKSDLNFHDKTITFTHLKNRKIQTFPIKNDLIKNIKEYLNVTELHTDFLFENSHDEPLTSKQLSVSFRRYCINRNVQTTSIHALRSVFAIKLIKSTGDLNLVRLALGHSSPNTTIIYLQNLGINDYSNKLQDFDLIKELK